jgi:solute carrier family 15 (oligopeptide transporter), member 1
MSESAVLGFFKGLLRHPKGFWFIFWGELAERCSYYGMRAILALYMVEKLGFTESNSGLAMSLFIGACYFLPLIGGWVADSYIGKYWTIVGFSIPYIVGHLILGIESTPFLIIALGLLAMGTGVIKPNISTLMGMTYDQQRPGDEALRSDAFGIFYMAINIGAVISQAALPYIRTSYGYQLAFAFPAALMVIAFILFAAGKKHYAVDRVIKTEELSPEQRANRQLILVLIGGVLAIFAAVTYVGIAAPAFTMYVGFVGFVVFAGAMAKVLGRLGWIFVIVTFFWAIFDQSASTWIFFAKKHFNLDVAGMHIEPDAIQAINPFLIVVLVPAFSILWRVFAARGREMRATDKMMIGFVLTASTMLVMGIAGFVAVSAGVKVSIAWQAGAYLFLTMAEVCISVVGLELAFVAAPAHMKSVVTACWLLCVSIANLCINAPITALYDKMAPGPYFMMLAGMMVPAIVAFAFIASRFNREVAARPKTAAVTTDTPPPVGVSAEPA